MTSDHIASMRLIVDCGRTDKLLETPELAQYMLKQDSYCNSDTYINKLKTKNEIENHLQVIQCILNAQFSADKEFSHGETVLLYTLAGFFTNG
jgi:hypothetical protein